MSEGDKLLATVEEVASMYGAPDVVTNAATQVTLEQRDKPTPQEAQMSDRKRVANVIYEMMGGGQAAAAQQPAHTTDMNECTFFFFFFFFFSFSVHVVSFVLQRTRRR
jgi:hypothetical protein